MGNESGAKKTSSAQAGKAKGKDVHMTVEIDFIEAMNGCTK